MIGVYLFAVVALVIWAVHFFNVRDDALLEELATTKRRMEQRKAAAEKRRSEPVTAAVAPDMKSHDNLESPLRQAEIKQQKQMDRARALPQTRNGTLPPAKIQVSDVPDAKDTVPGMVEGQSEAATTSIVEKIEKKSVQPKDADAEKESVQSN